MNHRQAVLDEGGWLTRLVLSVSAWGWGCGWQQLASRTNWWPEPICCWTHTVHALVSELRFLLNKNMKLEFISLKRKCSESEDSTRVNADGPLAWYEAIDDGNRCVQGNRGDAVLGESAGDEPRVRGTSRCDILSKRCRVRHVQQGEWEWDGRLRYQASDNASRSVVVQSRCWSWREHRDEPRNRGFHPFRHSVKQLSCIVCTEEVPWPWGKATEEKATLDEIHIRPGEIEGQHVRRWLEEASPWMGGRTATTTRRVPGRAKQ